MLVERCHVSIPIESGRLMLPRGFLVASGEREGDCEPAPDLEAQSSVVSSSEGAVFGIDDEPSASFRGLPELRKCFLILRLSDHRRHPSDLRPSPPWFHPAKEPFLGLMTNHPQAFEVCPNCESAFLFSDYRTTGVILPI